MSGYLKWLCNNKASAEPIVEPEFSHWVTELNLETGGERPLNDDISANQKPQKSSLPTDGEIRKLGFWTVYKVRNAFNSGLLLIFTSCRIHEGEGSWCTIQAGLTHDYMIGDIHDILMDGLPFTWRLSGVDNPIYHHASSHLAIKLIRWVYIITRVNLKLLKIPLWKGFHL